MTIPSRPAPAPPQQQQTSNQQSNTNIPLKLPPPPPPGSGQRSFSTKINSRNEVSSVTRHFPTARYAPATNWDGSPFDLPTSTKPTVTKKIPPPRPPPPRISPNTTGNTVLKKPGPPQSINVLSNLFGRRKGQTKANKTQQSLSTTNYSSTKLTSLPNVPQNNHHINRFTSQSSATFTTTSHITTSNGSYDVELIKFDSPSSSPTFTQKSNSDCVSVDSFSSDSNFSSPQNGSVSQPESGFEDDFLSPSDPWDAFNSVNNNSNNSIPPASRNYGFLNDIRVTQPVRNLNAINRSQNDNPLCNGKSLIPPQGSLSMPTIIKPKTSLYTSSSSSSPIHASNSSIKTPMQSTAPPQTFNAPFTNFPETFESFDDVESSPPMPSCPPPPPPTSAILGVISGRLDALDLFNDDDIHDASLSYGIALYDFEGTEDGDLSFKENEKVYILQRMNDEWYLGRNKRGCEGIFPSNYIEIKVPPKENVQSEKPRTTSSISSASALSSQVKVRVLYNFNAEVPEDLSLKENDMVTVLYKVNEDWLFGKLNNRQGQFPANFLEYIPQNLPNKMP